MVGTATRPGVQGVEDGVGWSGLLSVVEVRVGDRLAMGGTLTGPPAQPARIIPRMKRNDHPFFRNSQAPFPPGRKLNSCPGADKTENLPKRAFIPSVVSNNR